MPFEIGNIIWEPTGSGNSQPLEFTLCVCVCVCGGGGGTGNKMVIKGMIPPHNSSHDKNSRFVLL